MLNIKGHWFVDNKGRKVLLRGVNLAGTSKIPFHSEGTHVKDDFSGHRDVSFVGRPFPLEDADEHFQRLKHWGFNTLRLLTTWEAIEHKGPGIYDDQYLSYFTEIVRIAGEYDFFVFIDPHQDVWSRMTGGDGAPGWTFEKVGLDISKFDKSGAARTMQFHYPKTYKPMEWSFNYTRFATATMFTLFFGGKQFAPNLMIEDKNIQDYLQDHFIDSMLQIAKRIKDMDHVLGFDSLNEPDSGFIGISNLAKKPEFKLPTINPTPFDTMAAGAGFPRKVEKYKLKWYGVRHDETVILNPEGISNWLDGFEDIWQQHGVWHLNNGTPELISPDYFKYNPDGKEADFFFDYLRPFIIRYTEKIRNIIPHAMIFIEGEPLDPQIEWGKNDPKNVVNATHWYDGITLLTKKWRSWITVDVQSKRIVLFPYFVRRNYEKRLNYRKLVSQKIHDGIPTLIGEFGIPFDMDNKKAYLDSNFKNQEELLTLYYNLLDKLQLHSTLWNYTPDNNNEFGDLWNLEDLSIFSIDQQDNPKDINSGGRAIRAFSRPYPKRISGTPIRWKFNNKSSSFEFEYVNDPEISQPTVVYLPPLYYPNGIEIKINKGKFDFEIQNSHLLLSSGYNGKIKLEFKSK